MRVKTTEDLITCLKSGEYDGADLMQAWCRLRELTQTNKELEGELNHRIANHTALAKDAAKVVYEKEKLEAEVKTLKADRGCLISIARKLAYWRKDSPEFEEAKLQLDKFEAIEQGEENNGN